MSIRKAIHIIFVGFQLAKMHVTGYIASIISSVLWFTLMFIPTVLLSGLGGQALLMLAPGVFAMSMAMSSMWSATEFLRWYVNQGLTDLFRECGLNVFHYLFSGVLVDTAIAGMAGYLLSAVVASAYLGIDPRIFLQANPLYIALALIAAIPVYLAIGSLVGYILTATRISTAWISLLQTLTSIGTVIPPKVFPDPRIALVNPATIVAELFRAAYGTNIIPLNSLLLLTPPYVIALTLIGYWLGMLSEKRIARHGLEYRY
jgi:ABC-2 type transport system permease protein